MSRAAACRISSSFERPARRAAGCELPFDPDDRAVDVRRGRERERERPELCGRRRDDEVRVSR
ncbi:MAG TPA: hypothetical protein VJM49_04690, partial [Acidimicrobiales bacterium]|nr:hypothetical protein [Acidimicrobiales bacterium]